MQSFSVSYMKTTQQQDDAGLQQSVSPNENIAIVVIYNLGSDGFEY